MRPIPYTLRDELANDPYYKICARQNIECSGRITWEHAFIYAGQQINEKWAIIPLCWYHHLGEGLNKEINEQIALSRAKVEDLEKYPKSNWRQRMAYLYSKYGSTVPKSEVVHKDIKSASSDDII